MATKLLLIITTTIWIFGCVSSPYKKRLVDNGLGEKVERFFAYGNFCGGKYPANLGKTDLHGKLRVLTDFYPPVDDLDAICYAHDYCYDFPLGNNVTCDSVFHKMVINSQSNYSGEGCWNLVTDMTIAFFGKNWEKGNTRIETAANQIVQTTLGIPTAFFWAALKYPISPFLSDPVEGTCNLGDEPDIEAVFKEFETLYRDSLFNYNQIPIKILIPLPNK